MCGCELRPAKMQLAHSCGCKGLLGCTASQKRLQVILLCLFLFFLQFCRIGHDLAVMSQCNHAVASRGTFSFWVGFLAGGKIVYT